MGNSFKKFLCLLVAGQFLLSFSKAQKVPVSLPPSPNAASLGTFASFPNLQASGIPDIAIPIESIKLKEFELPITLRYNATGIKVGDRASTVGLGWILEAGGVITRVVNGRSDEVYRGRLSKLNGSTTAVESENLNLNGDEEAIDRAIFEKFAVAGGGGYSYFEAEPDIFYMNFAGHTGKFILDKQGIPSLVPYQNFKISYVKANEQDSTIISFKITDTSGNQYFFDDYETTSSEISSSYYVTSLLSNYRQPGTSYQSSTSAWYLTRILTAKGENVRFYYEKEYPETIQPYDYSLCVRNLPENSDPFAQSTLNFPQIGITSIIQNQLYNLRLSSIETDESTFQFEGVTRLDHDDQALSKIKIYRKYNGNNELMRSFTFDYTYFNCKYDFSIQVPQGKENQYYKKLKLDKLTQLDADNVAIGSYQFSYNQEYDIPSYQSKEQDVWGYYNLNNGRTLIPKLYVYPYNTNALQKYSVIQLPDNLKNGLEIVLEGENRLCNTQTVTAGMLKQVTFPTGGQALYEFESNEFDFFGKKVAGAGVRLKKYSLYDGISHTNDIVKEYKYSKDALNLETSGVLINMPVFAYMENTHSYVYSDAGNSVVVKPNDFSEYTKAYYQYFLTRVNMPRYSQNGLDGLNVSYNKITELNQDNSKTVSAYSAPGAFSQQNDDASNGCDILTQGSCDNLFSTAPQRNIRDIVYWKSVYGAAAIPALDERGMTSTGYGFPFAPNTNYDWNRGKLLNQKIFDASGKLAREVNYGYQLYIPSGGVKRIYGLKFIMGHNWKFTIDQNPNTSSPAPYFTLSKYNYLANVDKVLAYREEKLYNTGAGNNYTSNRVNYNYTNGSYKLISNEEVINSDGTSMLKKYRYPFDLANKLPYDVHNYPLTFMTYNNIIDKPVEVVTTLKRAGAEKVIGAELRLFTGLTKMNNDGSTFNMPVVKKSLLLHIDNPVNDYSSYNIGYEGYEEDYYDSRMKAIEDYAYDNKANIIKVGLADAKLSHSYLWGLNAKYPIMEAKNAEPSDIAFSDFETSNTGGWTYPGAYLYTSPNFLGKICYSLEGNGQINKTGLNPAKSYKLSMYFKDEVTVNGITVSSMRNVNDWSYGVIMLNNVSSINIDGDGLVDNLVLQPVESLVNTYVSEPLIGVRSSTDSNGNTTYFEYDKFQRLRNVKDHSGNIIKNYEYHYKP